MARVFLIESETPGEFLSPWGWASNKGAAFQFRTEDDARQYIRNSPHLFRMKHAVVPHDASEGLVGRGQVEIEYDPYGLRR